MFAPLNALLAVALLLTPLLGAELGVRSLIAAGRLPNASSSDKLMDVGLANLERLGKPDVLVMGTSAIRNALQPDVLEELIEEATGAEVHVQGIAQSAMSLRSQRLLVRGLAELDLLPDVVITGLTPVSLSGDHRDGDWFLESELGQLWSGCAAADDIGGSLDCWLGEASAAWRWRGRPDELLDASRGDYPTTARQHGRTLRENGWTAEAPATAASLRREIPEALERLEAHIDVPAYVAAEFHNLVLDLRDEGAQVVAVQMPYAPILEEALIARNPEWAQQRAAGFEVLEVAADIDIVDPGGFGDWATPTSFHDLRHLSRRGAEPFTRQLWELPEFREPLLAALALAD